MEKMEKMENGKNRKPGKNGKNRKNGENEKLFAWVCGILVKERVRIRDTWSLGDLILHQNFHIALQHCPGL